MEKFVEIKASSVELAVEKALEELKIDREQAEIEVLSKGGLFSKAQVRVSVKETASFKIAEFINGILDRMGIDARAAVTEDDEAFNIEVEGADAGSAIGYRGEVLDALQYLTLTYLNQEKLGYKKVVVDCENYREKRRETLTALALRLAEKAHKNARKIALEPMNPFERRIIHSALADSEIASTESDGEDADRHVVIVPKGVRIKDNRARGRRNERGDRGDRRERKDRDRRDRRPREDRAERPARERRERREEAEVEDGREFRGYYSRQDDFVKPQAEKTGPPKYKSFGGQKRF